MKVKGLIVASAIGVVILAVIVLLLVSRNKEPLTLVRYATVWSCGVTDYKDGARSLVTLRCKDKETGELFNAHRHIVAEKARELRDQAASLIEIVKDREEEFLFRLTLEPDEGEDTFRLLRIELYRQENEHTIAFYDIVGL